MANKATEETQERVATVRALVWAFLQSALNPGDLAFVSGRCRPGRAVRPLGSHRHEDGRSEPVGVLTEP